MLGVLLLAALLCGACHGPLPRAVNIKADITTYRFSTADLQIDLDLRSDGSYYARMDCWAKVSDEVGVWRMKADDIVLQARSGQLQLPIRKLGRVGADNADSWRIVDPDSEIMRAGVFRKADP